ncbi:MAG TPA: hypothetical protein VHW90_05355 [Stellaceae bacterium]|jgi:hypothetical protein|nr:hypothetical protein [Stellaceae bacterium]
MSLGEGALWWLPTAGVVGMTLLAVFAAATPPERPARRQWLATVWLCGALAIGLSVWQQTVGHKALSEEAERLHGLWSRLDDVGRLLPAGPGTTPDDTFDTVTAAIVSLNTKIKDLEEQIHALQEKTATRTIDPATAAKFAEYLRQFGSHRVVVSCLPDDVEGFTYANQIATVFKDAGWDAHGPEKTAIFGDAPSMAIKLYVRDGTTPPEAVKIVLDGFNRFNIPFQSGIAPSDALPDPQTVELFVSHKS